MKSIAKIILSAAAAFGLSACSSLTLEHVDFSWPVESVVSVSNGNIIEEGRYALVCNVGKVAAEEFQDSTALRGAKLRLLRNSEGYYFLTGPKFKHVYVFEPGESELSMKSSIEVSKNGLKDPALNQRSPYVELVDGESFERLLTSDEIVEKKKP